MAEITYSRYSIMKESQEKDIDSETYPDVLSVDYSTFKYTNPPVIAGIDETMTEKFYYKCYSFYGEPQWDDVILNLNSVPHISQLYARETLKFPEKNDLLSFVKGT